MEKTTKEKVHEYYIKHKEEILNVRWKDYLKNREKRIAQAKAWAAKNKDKVKAANLRWRKKHQHENKIRAATLYKYGKVTGNCVLCQKIGVHRHHNTIPYHVDKFVVLCVDCHYKIHRRRK